MEKSEVQVVGASESLSGRWNQNSMLGGAFSILALGFLFYIIPNYIEIPSHMQSPLLSPRFLPQLAGWLVLVLSILLLIGGLTKPPKQDAADELRRGVPVTRKLLMVAAGVVYVLFFEQLGAIGSGVLASVFLFLASELRGFWVYALAVIFPAIVTLLFIYILNVPLPEGTIWGYISLI